MYKFLIKIIIISLFVNTLAASSLTYGADLSEDVSSGTHFEILLLNAYHDGYIWSNDLKKGVMDTLDAKFSNYSLRIEHMDTKNINTEAYYEELYRLYSMKYEKDTFDVILSADDNALRFLMKYRDRLFGNTPVFFCGVNTLEAYPHLEDMKYVYGVAEQNSIGDTVGAALRQNPDIEDVYLVVEDTVTGKSTKSNTLKVMRKSYPQINYRIFENMTIYEIQDAVSELDPKTAIVIYAFYAVDVDGRVFALDYPSRLLSEASSVPVYSLYTFGFGTGTVGGKLIEGYTQGMRMVEFMSEYLSNGYVENRFIDDNSINRYKFDYNALRKYGLSVDALPKDSLVVNRPQSFYEDHKLEVNIGFFMLIMLVVYLVTLRSQVTSQTRKIESAQKELLEAEKLASLGRLVAGVAHEVNTPIGIGVTLASHMESISKKMGQAVSSGNVSKTEFMNNIEEMQETADHLLDTMDKASELIRSFKRVAIDQVSDEYRNVNMCNYMHEIVNSLRQELKKKNVDVRILCDAEVEVFTHAGAIYQILLNLIMNSLKHGFEGRENGIVDIKTSFTQNETEKMLHIKYRDYGVGMPPNVLKQIYEPFFTTKRDNGGSGLGMSIVYDLVTETLEGRIECSSAEQAGTEFIIDIPIKNGHKAE